MKKSKEFKEVEESIISQIKSDFENQIESQTSGCVTGDGIEYKTVNTGKKIEVKTAPKYFRDVVSGVKKFEIRKDDRDYTVGDTLVQREYKNGIYTGNISVKIIKYVLRDVPHFGLKSGYCILSL